MIKRVFLLHNSVFVDYLESPRWWNDDDDDDMPVLFIH